MHLSDIEVDRLLSSIDFLVDYIEDRELHGEEQEPFSFDQLVFDCLKFASEFPDVVDSALVAGGEKLTNAQRRLIEQWRGTILNDSFFIIGFSDDGNALMQSGMGVVEVTGLSQEISSLVPSVPCSLETNLLPFGDRIVFGSAIAFHPISYGPGMEQLFQEELDQARSGKKPVIRNAADYSEKVIAYKESRWESALEALLEEATQDDVTVTASVGVHRGELAGLSYAERERIIEGEVADAMKEVFRQFGDEMLDDLAQGKLPRQKLETALKDLSSFELEDCAYLVDCFEPGQSKSERIEAIVQKTLSTNAIKQFLMFSSERIYENFFKIVQAGGRVCVRKDDVGALWQRACLPPFSFEFYDEKSSSYVFFVDKRIISLLEDIDLVEAFAAREHMKATAKEANLYAELYGLVPLEELAIDQGQHRVAAGQPLADVPDPKDEVPYLAALLEVQLMYQDWDYRIEVIDDADYLVSSYLCFEEDDLEDGGLRQLPSSWKSILDRHSQMTRRPVETGMVEGGFYSWVMQLESAECLAQWLNANVPDGESDLHFADALMEKIFDSTRDSIDPQFVPRLLIETYQDALDAELETGGIDWFNDLLMLAMRFVNDIPVWDNYGWSPQELHDKKMGGKTFFHKSGKPMKVGRNDPCPCGSGKKYKKCCGR